MSNQTVYQLTIKTFTNKTTGQNVEAFQLPFDGRLPSETLSRCNALVLVVPHSSGAIGTLLQFQGEREIKTVVPYGSWIMQSQFAALWTAMTDVEFNKTYQTDD